MVVPYEKKFAEFIKGVEDSRHRDQAMLVMHPEALGDTYGELIESLERLAEAEIALLVMPKKSRPPEYRDVAKVGAEYAERGSIEKFYVEGDEEQLKAMYRKGAPEIGSGKSKDALKR